MIEWEAEATDAVGHDEANCARARQDEREWQRWRCCCCLTASNFAQADCLTDSAGGTVEEALAQRRRAVHGRSELFSDTRATQRARHVIASSV